MIKVEAKLNEYDAARLILVKEVAALKQSSAAASFEREERRIRLNPPNQAEWEQLNQSQKEELTRKHLKEVAPNVKVNEVEIFIIRQGRSIKAPGWVKLTFQVKEQKFSFEKAAIEWRKKNTNGLLKIEKTDIKSICRD